MRDIELQVFISSKMRKNTLKLERKAAIEAIEQYPGAKPWNWECCGHAAPYPPMTTCLEAVVNSDILILLLGYELTENTKKEHETAVSLKIPDFIFVKDGNMKRETRDYLELQQSRATYMKFKTTSELKTMITMSLIKDIVRTYRNSRPKIGTHASYSMDKSREKNA